MMLDSCARALFGVRFQRSFIEITRRSVPLLVFVAMLGGCAGSTTGPSPAAGPQPTVAQVEAVVRNFLHDTLKDPDSIKQFSVVSGPTAVTWNHGLISGGEKDAAWLVCFSYNAKNSYGMYVGVRTEGVAVRQFFEGAPLLVVRDVNWVMASSHC